MVEMERSRMLRSVSPFTGVVFQEKPVDQTETISVFVPRYGNYDDVLSNLRASYNKAQKYAPPEPNWLKRQNSERQAISSSLSLPQIKTKEKIDKREENSTANCQTASEQRPIRTETSNEPQRPKNNLHSSEQNAKKTPEGPSQSLGTSFLDQKGQDQIHSNLVGVTSQKSDVSIPRSQRSTNSSKKVIDNLLRSPYKPIPSRHHHQGFQIKRSSGLAQHLSCSHSISGLNVSQGGTARSAFSNEMKGRQILDELKMAVPVLERNQSFAESFEKVKKLGLLERDQPLRRFYGNIGKPTYIYNDYHTKKAAAGFSRKKEDGSPFFG